MHRSRSNGIEPDGNPASGRGGFREGSRGGRGGRGGGRGGALRGTNSTSKSLGGSQLIQNASDFMSSQSEPTTYVYLFKRERDMTTHAEKQRFIISAMEHMASDVASTMANAIADLSSDDVVCGKIEYLLKEHHTWTGLPVEPDAQPISFQHVVFPFFQLITGRSFKVHALPKHQTSVLVNFLDPSLLESAVRCVKEMIGEVFSDGTMQNVAGRARAPGQAAWPVDEMLADHADWVFSFYPQFWFEAVAPVIRIMEMTAQTFHQLPFEPGFHQAITNLAEVVRTCSGHRRALTLEAELKRLVSLARKRTASIRLDQSDESQIASLGQRQRKLRLEDQKFRFLIAEEQDDRRAEDFPGALSLHGPRHDNDHASILDISIMPTRDEILCDRPSYLPRNNLLGTHHLPADSMARLLDSHFRLLREDMLAPIRLGLLAFIDAGGLEGLAKFHRGIFRPESNLERGYLSEATKQRLRVLRGEHARTMVAPDGDAREENTQDVEISACADLFVVHDVTIDKLRYDRRSGLLFELSFMTPVHAGVSHEAYWTRARHFQFGSLVCVVELNSEPLRLQFAIVMERDMKKLCAQRPQLSLGLLDIKGSTLLDDRLEESTTLGNSKKLIMVQATGAYFEAYRPVLLSLQEHARNPESVPFADMLLAPPAQPGGPDCSPRPKFPNYLQSLMERGQPPVLDLSVIFSQRKDYGTQKYMVNLADEQSVESMQKLLFAETTLEEVQSRALLHALKSEFALLQGPPGTGKTYLGVWLVKILLANSKLWRNHHRHPIVVVTFTNHALDAFLEDIYEAGTKRICRVGGRSKSELLNDRNINAMIKGSATSTNLGWQERNVLIELEKKEKEFARLSTLLSQEYLEWSQVSHFLEVNYPVMFKNFQQVSKDVWNPWVHFLKEGIFQCEQRQQEQSVIQEDVKQNAVPPTRPRRDYNRYEILGLMQENESEEGEEEDFERGNGDGKDFSDYLSHPEIDDDSPIVEAQAIWNLSWEDRLALYYTWRDELRAIWKQELDSCSNELDCLREEHSTIIDLKKIYLIEHHVDVIGFTTSGLARERNLVGRLAPKILVIEEAAELLEAHVLSSLSASAEHLILIGDHLQLRPKCENWALSIDNSKRALNLDLSLFERMVQADVPKVTLSMQRRMRSIIADIPRALLYPDLTDSEVVKSYERVRGMGSNLAFLNHTVVEDAQDKQLLFGLPGRSKTNFFEVGMVVRLVAHLVRNGYQTSKRLVVLTPYLSQMAMIRDRLNNEFMIVSEISDRDMQEEAKLTNPEADILAEGSAENLPDEDSFERNTLHVVSRKEKLSSMVRIASIDNYQGEEADVVIISCVRSGGQSIGFIRSINRVNVLLSRARHGMYLIGNLAHLEEKSDVWKVVSDVLTKHEAVHESWPLRCENHEGIMWVSSESEFARASPEGGCAQPCSSRLPCGHPCSRACHPDDKEHLLSSCHQSCNFVFVECGHLCQKLCREPHGECMQEIREPLKLPCGHTVQEYSCVDLRRGTIRCEHEIEVQHPICGHKFTTTCYKARSVRNAEGLEACSALLACGHPCQRLRSKTRGGGQWGVCKFVCEKSLGCGHHCKAICHPERKCARCTGFCLFGNCSHSTCTAKCDHGCTRCAKQCMWHCEHQGGCALPCGAPCARNLCNERCSDTLACGCRCPGLCGEKCPDSKYCPNCVSNPDYACMVVDLLKNEALKGYDPSAEGRTPLIALDCGHIFTMETLDGHIGLQEYYTLQTGQILQLPLKDVNVPQCPFCRFPISNVHRYGRALKYAQLCQVDRAFRIGCDSVRSRIVEQCNLFEQLMPNLVDEFYRAILEMTNANNTKVVLERLFDNHLKQLHDVREAGMDRIGECTNSPCDALLAACKAFLLRAEANPHRRNVPRFDDLVDDVKQQIPFLSITHEVEVRMHIAVSQVDAIKMNYYFECVLILSERLAGIRPSHTGFGLGSFLTHEVCKAAMKELYAKYDQAFDLVDMRLRQAISMACESKLYATVIRLKRDWIVLRVRRIDGWEKSRQCFFGSNGRTQSELRKGKLADLEGYALELDELRSNAKNHLDPSERGVLFADRTGILTRIRAMKEALVYGTYFDPNLKAAEMKMIFQVMSQNEDGTGQWYRCPDGHRYFIGNCGGDMKIRRCPECEAANGSTGHNLLPDNQQDRSMEQQAFRKTGLR